MNKYYKFEASTPYSGTTTEHFVKFENEPSEANQMTWRESMRRKLGRTLNILLLGGNVMNQKTNKKPQTLKKKSIVIIMIAIVSTRKSPKQNIWQELEINPIPFFLFL